MYPDLAGKVAVVTGSSKGIGRGIALRYGQERMKVVVNYVSDAEHAHAAVEEILASGGEAIAYRADISKEEEVKQLLEAAISAFGGLDVLVNNAGIQSMFPSHTLSLDEWNRIMNINLTGAFLGCREAIDYMLKHQVQGRIINVSSVHQKIPKPQHAHYAASKGGLRLMTETLALEYASRRIRINTIAPGAIDTPLNEKILGDPVQKNNILSLIPMNRIGESREIAAAAAWLASDESSYITGVTLFVDGGMTL